MNTTIALESVESIPQSLLSVEAACKKIPPLWPLKHFVAVNPFVGLSQLDFADACRMIEKVGHAGMTLSASAYAAAWERGEITEADLAEAAAANTGDWTVESLRRALGGCGKGETPRLTVADALDHRSRSRWGVLIVEEISKWCAAYYDEGQALWPMPWRTLPLFKAWKRGAELDCTPEVSGLPGFRACILRLPDDALLAIELILGRLGLPESEWEEFLHRQLMTVRGWAGYVQYCAREKTMRGVPDDSLAQFLAIRLAYDFALHEAFGPCAEILERPATSPQGAPALAVWQDALENAHRRLFLEELRQGSAFAPALEKKFQAVFCIDVRSEVFRRALENAEPRGETLGFAGFFGFPLAVSPALETQGAARCPVLLVPSHTVRETPSENPERTRRRQALSGLWKLFKSASITCFPFVESLGLTYAGALVRHSLARPQSPPSGSGGAPGYELEPDACGCGIPEASQAALAEGALRNMGLVSGFARLVLLCGHGSHTTNNPFGSSLDCGACGGHAGDANARVAAAILNKTAVRRTLAEKGIVIPEETRFVAGLHNTTTDEVVLFDTEPLLSSHARDLAELQAALQAAGHSARQERSLALGIEATAPGQLRAAVEERARHWAQVRPEWGLAGNCAFIAAPRARTAGLKLDGRVFLHNYDHGQDREGKTLELILCAPMVVASWINLQYYGSSVNNTLFGSGNKVLHNVVGKLGVLEGNGGDLRTGLPRQSVHTGSDLAHLPLRLNVLIEAPHRQIDAVLARHETVRHLVDNRWLHLHAIESATGAVLRRKPGGGWS